MSLYLENKMNYETLKEKYWNHLFIYNIILALILVILIKLILESFLFPNFYEFYILSKTKDIYTVIATIGGTLLGFIITSISIIIAFTESDKIKILRQTNHYKSLFNIYFNTIKILAITTILAIIGILANYEPILFYIILMFVITSILFIWASIWALEQIIE